MKKLIVLLVVLALSAPVLADVTEATPLLVDIGVAGQSQTKAGWQGWGFGSPWISPSSPIDFTVGTGPYSIIHANLEAFGSTANPPAASRTRDGGMAFVPGTGEYGITTKGYGTHYLKLSLSGLEPSKEYQITLWSWETTGVWSMNSANPNSKFVEWAALNPLDWLLNNGYDGTKVGEPTGGGYGPKVGTDNPAASTDSNMPAGLVAAIAAVGGKRATLDAGATDLGDSGLVFTSANAATFRFKATDYIDEDYPGGTADIYGWNDCTDWAGSNHTPLSGFMIVPEPATMTLLGLGALALLRRKRA